ncbi:unnamed protein product [Prunus armeniaca]
MQHSNRSISEGSLYEPELSDFKDQSISDGVQNLVNVIIWWEESFGPIDIGLSPKLGEQHNMVGGVIWSVLSDIQLLKLCNTPTAPFRKELATNRNFPISRTSRYRMESKSWGTSQYGGRSHSVRFE